jgi:hypothetical protein
VLAVIAERRRHVGVLREAIVAEPIGEEERGEDDFADGAEERRERLAMVAQPAARKQAGGQGDKKAKHGIIVRPLRATSNDNTAAD